MPGTAKREFAAILAEFHRHHVDLIIVGGIAAVLEGVPVHTLDLDIVPSGEADNMDRLRRAVDSLDAARPALPLDIHAAIGRSRGYDDLLPHTNDLEVGEGLRVRVLDLETLIAVKEEVAAERDLAVLPIMRRTLEEKRRL